MLSVIDFAARYNVSPSWARRQIKAGRLRSKRIKGRYHIAPEDAERWLSEHSRRGRVRNISRPDLPPIVLGDADFQALLWCARGYNVQWVEAHINMEWRVGRLRKLGFNIERINSNGLPCYCLKGIFEMDLQDGPYRLGPHPDLWNVRPFHPRLQ
jgi:hypothetical protein